MPATTKPAPDNAASIAGFTMPVDYSPTVVDLDGLPQAIAAVIRADGRVAELTQLYELLDAWGESQRTAVLKASQFTGSEKVPRGPTLAEWNENAKVLLDSYPQSVRSCYKGGPENLIESMCITFIGMRDALSKRMPGRHPGSST